MNLLRKTWPNRCEPAQFFITFEWATPERDARNAIDTNRLTWHETEEDAMRYLWWIAKFGERWSSHLYHPREGRPGFRFMDKDPGQRGLQLLEVSRILTNDLPSVDDFNNLGEYDSVIVRNPEFMRIALRNYCHGVQFSEVNRLQLFPWCFRFEIWNVNGRQRSDALTGVVIFGQNDMFH